MFSDFLKKTMVKTIPGNAYLLLDKKEKIRKSIKMAASLESFILKHPILTGLGGAGIYNAINSANKNLRYKKRPVLDPNNFPVSSEEEYSYGR